MSSTHTAKRPFELVPLQQAMRAGQLDYWHRPEAMWLVLGLYALGGCLIALLIRGWLTRGVRLNGTRPAADETKAS